MVTKKEKKELEKEHEKNRKVAEEYQQYEEQYLKQLEDNLFSLQEKKGLYGFDASDLVAEYMEAYEENNVEAMNKVLFESERDVLEIALGQNRDTIIKWLKTYNKSIKNILDLIYSNDEADAVLEAIIGSIHILLLPRGYNMVRKFKQHNQARVKTRCVPVTYERALRRNRNMLESDLKQLGAGAKRAKEISKILYFIKS